MKNIIFLPSALSDIPVSTGVYLFLDSHKKPIYIGKAGNLRMRVRQHLENKIDLKERSIAAHSVYLEWRETRSEFEALLLEAQLVLKHQPTYNVELKDDKSYLYIVVIKETYPKVLLARKRDIEVNIKKYTYIFGPISSVRLARFLISRLRRISPFCAERHIGKKPCFYSHVGLCNPCPNSIEVLLDETEKLKQQRTYRKNIRRVIKILKGGGRELVEELTREMRVFSKEEKYEQATMSRDRLHSLEELFSVPIIRDGILVESPHLSGVRARQESEALRELLQLPQLSRIECYDVSTFQFKNSTASMVVFENGIPVKGEYRRFKIKTSKKFDPDMLLGVLHRRMQRHEWKRSDLIVIDGGAPQLLAIYLQLKEEYTDLPEVISIAKHPDRILVARIMRYLNLPKNSPALFYVARMRDEAHRFARNYHILLRRKSIFSKG